MRTDREKRNEVPAGPGNPRIGWMIAVSLAVTAWAGIQVATLRAAAPGPDRASKGVGNGHEIRLGEYRFDPLVGVPDLPAALKSRPGSGGGSDYYLVQLDDRITPGMKQELEATGAVPLHYIQSNAFVIRADATALRLVRALPFIRWTGPFEPAYRLSSRLAVEYDEI